MVKLKFLGNKRKNKALLSYYQKHLKPLAIKKESLDQKKSTGEDFEKIVLASKDRLTFHLSDLVEFGADQGDLTKTVFYHPIENKLYVGKSVPFPIIFTPSASTILWYLLVDRAHFSAWFSSISPFIYNYVSHRSLAI